MAQKIFAENVQTGDTIVRLDRMAFIVRDVEHRGPRVKIRVWTGQEFVFREGDEIETHGMMLAGLAR